MGKHQKNMIYQWKVALLAILMIFTRCNEAEVLTLQVSGNDIDFLRAIDVKNSNDASDIVVQFVLSTESQAQDIRIILSKVRNIASELPEDPDFSLSSPHFKRAAIAGKPYRFQLDRNLTDIDGDRIRNNIDYLVTVAFVDLEGAFTVSDNKTFIKLTDVHPLQGQYKGVWNDDVDGTLPVSLLIQHEDGLLTGSFFFTNIYEPCCSDINDGQVLMTLLPGGVLKDFIFEQNLQYFDNGQSCLGTFTGEGVVQDFTRLNITYTGSDCLGQHFGTLIIDRQ